MTTMANSMLLT
ncbi:hypothetical protein D046_5951A, partial [Vibrio parahaemolyticus V-223/04]